MSDLEGSQSTGDWAKRPNVATDHALRAAVREVCEEMKCHHSYDLRGSVVKHWADALERAMEGKP